MTIIVIEEGFEGEQRISQNKITILKKKIGSSEDEQKNPNVSSDTSVFQISS